LLESKYPVTERPVSRAATAAGSVNSFKAVAQEWLAMKQRAWSAVHYAKSQRVFERDIYPGIGSLPIASTSPAIVAKAIADIHQGDVATPHCSCATGATSAATNSAPRAAARTAVPSSPAASGKRSHATARRSACVVFPCISAASVRRGVSAFSGRRPQPAGLFSGENLE
jgi:hypothetical protein